MDDDGIPAFHIAYGNTGTEDHFSAGINRVDNRVIEDRDIPVGNDRAFDTALTPDDSTPAADIECDTGPGTQFKGPRYRQPAPEMRMGGNNKITVDLYVPFEIRSFLCKKSISLL
jgi:hypothetical protein